jgi:hypothetical protein
MDYRDALRAKGFRPMTDSLRRRLRTARLPGTAEIVGDRLIRYGEEGSIFPLDANRKAD